MPGIVAQRLTLRVLAVLFVLSPVYSCAEPSGRLFRLAVINDVPSTQLAIQLLSAAYEKLGIRIETTMVPSRRALYTADQGLVDGDLFRVEEVASQYPNLIQVPYPLMQGSLLAIVPSDQEDRFPQATDKPLLAGVRRGVIIAEMTANRLGMKPVRANSYAQMKVLLERGRVDLLLVSDIEGLSPADNSEWRDLVILAEPVTRFSLFHYLNLRHSDLAIPLANALKELDRKGLKARLVEDARNKPELEQW